MLMRRNAVGVRLSLSFLVGALGCLIARAQDVKPAPAVETLPVKTARVHSPAVDRDLKYQIILPKDYDTSSDRYPVLYLLHGFTGNYTNWARMNVPKFAAEHRLIIVIPDAGNSWYANWAQSDEGEKNLWEDYMIKDLIPHIDSNYRTIASREGRAINGLSMGGYGAIMLGLRHPDLFCSIGSHSGALGFAKSIGERIKSGSTPKARREPSNAPNPEIGVEGFSSQVERTPKGKLFTNAEEAAAYDPFQLVLQVAPEKMPHIYIDCGVDDGLVKSSREFVQLLMEKKIPFTYAESAGGHNPQYWSREVGHSMSVQAHLIERSPAKARTEKSKESAPAATKDDSGAKSG